MSEQIRCKNCSSHRISQRLFEKRGRDFYRCLACGLVMQHPLPTSQELRDFYSQDYYAAWGLHVDEAQVEGDKRKTFALWIRTAFPAAPQNEGAKLRWLDIGAANGVLLEAARERGYEPWGVEISSYAAAISRKKFGEKHIFCGKMEEANFPDGFFDVVSMCDLIEHVENPGCVLAEVHRVLKPGGRILITTPNVTSFSARALKKQWPNFLPEHLLYFNRRNIVPFLQRSGFSIQRMRKAWKYLSLGYISSWFSKNRIPLVTPFFQWLDWLTPRSLKRIALPFVLGDMLVAGDKVSRPRMSPVRKISIIIPAFNERTTIAECVRRVISTNPCGLPIEVIVVESHSKDGTRGIVEELARAYPIRTVFEDRPMGKGHAVREGLKVCTGQVVIIQDADLEYSVNDYDKLVEPILRGDTAFVLGSRVLGAKHWAIRRFSEDFIGSLIFNMGGMAVNAFFNLLYRTKLTDQATMFKVFHVDALRRIQLTSNSWDLDVEIIAKLVRAGHLPLEIPVHYESRSAEEGKKMKLKDVFVVLGAMIRFRSSDLNMNISSAPLKLPSPIES